MLRALMRRALTTVSAALATAGLFSACGSKADPLVGESAQVKAGAQLFSQRCMGCHTLDTVNALGGATNIKDRERVDGPNFNVRKEQVSNVLYAIRNGGYSAAIMPQNIVVGKDADDVAVFLAKYSGLDKVKSAGPGG
jgi:mono/diheme cytochrome c family protein